MSEPFFPERVVICFKILIFALRQTSEEVEDDTAEML